MMKETKSSVLPMIILVVAGLVLLAYFTGFGFASGGGQVGLFSPSVSAEVNAENGVAIALRGNRNTLEWESQVLNGDQLPVEEEPLPVHVVEDEPFPVVIFFPLAIFLLIAHFIVSKVWAALFFGGYE